MADHRDNESKVQFSDALPEPSQEDVDATNVSCVACGEMFGDSGFLADACPHGEQLCDSCATTFKPEEVCQPCRAAAALAEPLFGRCVFCDCRLNHETEISDACFHGVRVCGTCALDPDGFPEIACEECTAQRISFRFFPGVH